LDEEKEQERKTKAIAEEKNKKELFEGLIKSRLEMA